MQKQKLINPPFKTLLQTFYFKLTLAIKICEFESYKNRYDRGNQCHSGKRNRQIVLKGLVTVFV